jgi:outer membrane lipopolysaccharide assembly protein LptE/RlpB
LQFRALFDEDQPVKSSRGISLLFVALLSAQSGAMTGCGYGFQGSHSELMEKENIHRVFIKPLLNNTYKPGVENVVYNALVKSLLIHRRVQLVQKEEDADAILTGSVGLAQFSGAPSTTADKLSPLGLPLKEGSVNIKDGARLSNISMVTLYTALLSCSFSLNRTQNLPNRRNALWAASFSRQKPFPASNQLDVPGATSALINESEFERALGELAIGMMDDVHESMLAMF